MLLAAPAAFAAEAFRIWAPAPVHADGESSAEMPVAAVNPAERNLKVSLTLDATTAGSNAEVALGDYTPGDDPDGTSAILGYGDGEFFILGGRLQTRLAVPAAPPSSGSSTLTARVRLDSSGAPTRVTFEADGKAVPFGGLAPTSGVLRAWFDPAALGALRLTSRGGAKNVSATLRAYPDGTVTILR